jgi:hypothetical protein
VTRQKKKENVFRRWNFILIIFFSIHLDALMALVLQQSLEYNSSFPSWKSLEAAAAAEAPLYLIFHP